MFITEIDLYESFGGGRREFCNMINNKNYKIGVEVGIRDGGHCEAILKESNLDILYGVDIASCKLSGLLERSYQNRFKFINKNSVTAAGMFENEYFDFIYIDAWHSYESVKEDLNAWWPKLKSGGCLSGDDYMDFDCPGECRFGVIQAVEEFAEQKQLDVNIIGLRDATRQDRINFGNEQGQELNKKWANLPNKFLFNPQWYIYK